jgi:hypothetical protein
MRDCFFTSNKKEKISPHGEMPYGHRDWEKRKKKNLNILHQLSMRWSLAFWEEKKINDGRHVVEPQITSGSSCVSTARRYTYTPSSWRFHYCCRDEVLRIISALSSEHQIVRRERLCCGWSSRLISIGRRNYQRVGNDDGWRCAADLCCCPVRVVVYYIIPCNLGPYTRRVACAHAR